MPSRKRSQNPPRESAPPDPAKIITVVPPGGPGAVRSQIPTLVDDAELEAARLASMSRSSIPPASHSSIPPVLRSEAPRPTEEKDPALGSLARVPFVTVPFDRLPSLAMDSRMGFLVALIDGASSIQNILDMASMPQRDVLQALAALRDLGVVGFRDE